MSEQKHTPLGSGLSVDSGESYRAPQKPHAAPLPDNRWRAELVGVESGRVVRSWVGPVYSRRDAALRAAIAKATGQ